MESIIIDYIKEILCETEFDNLLCDRLDNQPLGLYEWTNNMPYTTHEDVRGKLITNYMSKAMTNNDMSTSSMLSVKRNMLSNQRNSSSQQSHHSKHKNQNENKDMETFNEAQESKLEDKYLNELIDKFKYTVPDVNEKILLINDDSRNLIHSVLENTIYNIVAEAVYGETDLSEKTKIYFFKR